MERASAMQIESKMLHFAKEHTKNLEQMRFCVKRLSVRACFASRGRNMGFRGMYSPSMALKYLVGNATAGRLLRQAPKKENGHYLYEFDEDNRLIYAKQFACVNESDLNPFEEFIFYHERDQYSLVFQGGEASPHTITLCESWDELPNCYSQLRMISGIDCCSLEIEQYEYSQGKISRIEWFILSKNDNKNYEGVSYVSEISIDEFGNEIASDLYPRLFGH